MIKKRATNPRSLESLALITLKSGQYFFTPKQDKDITAISSYYGVKIKTERHFVLNPQTGETEKIIKVYIL